jgi:adenylyltransferase/sulfurtransferase
MDNREARVAINQAAARTGRIWIDGAIERLEGVARVFNPAAGPCYECTMSELDWKLVAARRSCALLSRQDMEAGKVPTTPTTASVIAGIQCQEAVKLLHGRDVIAGQGFVFDGYGHQSYLVRYARKEGCMAHDRHEPLQSVPWKVSETRVGQLLERVRTDLGADAVLETNQDLLASLACERCRYEEPLLASLGHVTEERGRCPRCGESRAPRVFHTIDGHEPFLLDKTLGEIGIPAWDILGGRSGTAERFYEFAGDQGEVLGLLAGA